ncbi:MAG TPA: hypothetical protein VL461_09595 [Dictyobacter sp.]|jgi:hypothetical protein|nr:hypothetical protein [Dictyobacter sp.]
MDRSNRRNSGFEEGQHVPESSNQRHTDVEQRRTDILQTTAMVRQTCRNLNPEQLREIHQVKASVIPWLNRYLLNHDDIRQNRMAKDIALKINEEFEREASERPRQPIGTLIRDSINTVRASDRIANSPERLQLLDTIEKRIQNMWHGNELKEQQSQLEKIEQEITLITSTLENWSGNQQGYKTNPLEKRLTELRSQQNKTTSGIERLQSIQRISPPDVLPSYEE